VTPLPVSPCWFEVRVFVLATHTRALAIGASAILARPISSSGCLYSIKGISGDTGYRHIEVIVLNLIASSTQRKQKDVF